jgi:hypothetical protein
VRSHRPRPQPFANSASFGDVGAYERVRGVAKGELDPADPRNKGIVNIDRVPRNARGRVEYEVEWFMDAPTQAAGAVNDPKTKEDAGNALFFRRAGRWCGAAGTRMRRSRTTA